MQALSLKRLKIILGVFLIASILAGCGTIPKQEVRTYADAFEQVKKTSDTVLRQYAKDLSTDSPATNSSVNGKPGRYLSELPVISIESRTNSTNPDVAARLAVLEQIAQYNKILIAITYNRPFTQTHLLANQFGVLLKKGVGIASSAVGIPADVLDTIINEIKNAKTRAELIRALRKATVSQDAYEALMADKDDAQLREVLKDPVKVECNSEIQATCVSLITIALELMQKDVDSFFDARHGVVLVRRENEIGGELGDLRRKLNSYLRDRQMPTEGVLRQSYISAELEFNTVLREVLESKYISYSFPFKSDGSVYNQESKNIVDLYVATAQDLNQKDLDLASSLNGWIIPIS